MSDPTYNNEYENNIPKEIADIKEAILSQDIQRLKLLLTNQTLDEVQKSFLIHLAETKGSAKAVAMIENTPATP